jgi:hypothetical protein
MAFAKSAPKAAYVAAFSASSATFFKAFSSKVNCNYPSLKVVFKYLA